jgi:hypothetical protein
LPWLNCQALPRYGSPSSVSTYGVEPSMRFAIGFT